MKMNQKVQSFLLLEQKQMRKILSKNQNQKKMNPLIPRRHQKKRKKILMMNQNHPGLILILVRKILRTKKEEKNRVKYKNKKLNNLEENQFSMCFNKKCKQKLMNINLRKRKRRKCPKIYNNN